jgi:hypothetical protein
MQPTKISTSAGLTIKLGNFETMRLDCSIEGLIQPGEDQKAAFDVAWAAVVNELDGKVNELRAHYREVTK